MLRAGVIIQPPPTPKNPPITPTQNPIIINNKKLNSIPAIGRRILKIFGLQTKYAMIMHDYTNPYSTNLPKELKVGEKLTLLLDMDQDSLLSVNPTHVGVIDSFGRYHWATHRSLRQAKKEYFEEYEKKPWGSERKTDIQPSG